MTSIELLWLIVGFGAQALFGARMIVQWWISERRGASVVPLCFWYMSLAGGMLMLAYAIWLRDPVVMTGQGLGLFVYFRNIALALRGRHDEASASNAPRAECRCVKCGAPATLRAAA
jgi:lipid-A-disaccharide synthase-like uncharacterized protein